MKKILLFFAVTWIAYSLHAQCTVTNTAIHLKSITTLGTQCQVVFDFSWDEDVNPGNKYAYIHLWRSDQYPALEANNLAYTTSGAPTAADLVNTIANIVIENNGGPEPTIGTIYHPDPAVVILSTGLDVVKEAMTNGMERMTIQNISLTISNCTGTSIVGDIWASESEHANVHCVSSNVGIIVGNPRITGLLNCQLPRQYSTQITNVGDGNITFTYNVYVDEGDGVYEPAVHDTKVTPTAVGPFTLTPGSIYNSGLQSYLPYSSDKPYADNDLWVEVITQGFPNTAIYRIENTCIPLSITLSSFTARRNDKTVELKWATSSELNNSGFEIQRQIDMGNFQPLVFIESKAPGGNSQQKLDYNFTDVNPTKAVTTYRIRQVDINGQSKFTDARLVRGMDQRGAIMIYPNPALSGSFRILYETAGTNNDVTLFDVNGRTIRQWNNITVNNLFVEGLQGGMYLLRVKDRVTNEINTVKITVLNNK